MPFLVLGGYANTTFSHEEAHANTFMEMNMDDCCQGETQEHSKIHEDCCEHTDTDSPDCEHNSCSHGDCCIVWSNIPLPLPVQSLQIKNIVNFTADENFGENNFSSVEIHTIWIPPKLNA